METTNKSNNGNNKALATVDNKVVKSNALDCINFYSQEGLAQAELILKRLITSEKSGIKRVEDGLAIMMRAKDLGLPFTTCVEHIHLINGKTGVDVHIIKSLLSRAGVTWKCVKEYTPLYQYTDGNNIYLETQLPSNCVKCKNAKDAEAKSNDDSIGVYPLRYYQDLKGNIYNEFEVSDKCIKAISKAHAMQVAKEGKFPVIRVAAQPIDYITEYEFTRYKMINGKERIITCNSHFTYSEAQLAGLFTKETYTKYARVLIGHRAFTLGARDIAADVIMGLMESSELKIVEGYALEPSDYIDEADIVQ